VSVYRIITGKHKGAEISAKIGELEKYIY